MSCSHNENNRYPFDHRESVVRRYESILSSKDHLSQFIETHKVELLRIDIFDELKDDYRHDVDGYGRRRDNNVKLSWVVDRANALCTAWQALSASEAPYHRTVDVLRDEVDCTHAAMKKAYNVTDLFEAFDKANDEARKVAERREVYNDVMFQDTSAEKWGDFHSRMELARHQGNVIQINSMPRDLSKAQDFLEWFSRPFTK